MNSFFSLDFCDQETGFLVHETYLESFGEELPIILKERMAHLQGNKSEPIDAASLEEVPLFKEKLAQWKSFSIRVRHELSHLPYRVHGGREYDLMSKGAKPLAVFDDPSSDLSDFLKRYFDPMVNSEKSVVKKIDDNNAPSKILYALTSEAWRIEVYNLMWSMAKLSKWNDTLEYLQGYLLGYTQQQNELWLDYRKKNGLKWGLQKIYVLVTDEEKKNIFKLGNRILIPSDTNEDNILFFLSQDKVNETEIKTALSSFDKKNILKFYIPVVKFLKFSKGTKTIQNIKFKTFELPKNELVTLNQAIDGTIESV